MRGWALKSRLPVKGIQCASSQSASVRVAGEVRRCASVMSMGNLLNKVEQRHPDGALHACIIRRHIGDPKTCPSLILCQPGRASCFNLPSASPQALTQNGGHESTRQTADTDRRRPDRHRGAPAHERQGGHGLCGALWRRDPCAKIYKEATHRSFRQAVDYTENRKVKNTRQARAMAKGTQVWPPGAGSGLAERRGRRAVPPGRTPACACPGRTTSSTACC